MEIGENIKMFRKAFSLTQAQLAKEIGVAEITIRKYEADKRKPSYDMLSKIADVLDTPISDLIYGRPSMRTPQKPFKTGTQMQEEYESEDNADITPELSFTKSDDGTFAPIGRIDTNEIVEIVDDLSDDNQKAALSYLRYLKEQENKDGEPDAT